MSTTPSRAADCTPGATVDLDSRDSGSVQTPCTLASGQLYDFAVSGTVSFYPVSDWQGGSCGAPEAAPQTPSPATTNGPVNADAELAFADPAASCSEPYPHHYTSFQINPGNGFTHVEPGGSVPTAPPAGHIYHYTITGQGPPASFELQDSNSSDNYGVLKIEVVPPPTITLSPSSHNCSLPCTAAFVATVRDSSGAPLPGAQVGFGIHDAAGNVVTGKVLTGVNPHPPPDPASGTSARPNVNNGVTDANGNLGFEVAAATGAEKFSQLVGGDQTGPKGPDALVIPASMAPQDLTIKAALSRPGGGQITTTAGWHLEAATVSAVLVRNQNPQVSIDGAIDPYADVGIFVFDRFGNQYHFGMYTSAKFGNHVYNQEISRFVQGGEGHEPNLDCGGDIVCAYEQQLDNGALLSLPLFTYGEAERCQGCGPVNLSLNDIVAPNDPIQGPYAALYRVSAPRDPAGHPMTGAITVSGAAEAGVFAYGGFSPHGEALMPVGQSLGSPSNLYDITVSFGTGSSTVLSTKLKHPSFFEKAKLGLGLVGCAGLTAETAGFAAFAGCGNAVITGVTGFLQVQDPPLGPYERIAVPRALPRNGIGRRVCRLLRVSSGCSRLVRTGAAYNRSASTAASFAEALSATFNRFSAAQKAHDFRHADAQQAAARALFSLYGRALSRQRSTARQLAALLTTLHANRRLSTGQVKRLISKGRRAGLRLQGIPKRVVSRMLQDGIAADKTQLGQMLASAVGNARAGSVTLAQLITAVPKLNGSAQYLEGMTWPNVEGFISTIVVQSKLAGTAKGEQLRSDARALDGPTACTAKRRTAKARRLLADIRRSTTGSLRTLASATVTPLLKYLPGRSATLPSCH